MSKQSPKAKFEPSTEVLTAKISVTRKVEGENKGELSLMLDFETKKVEVDLSTYRKMPITNLILLGEALIALGKEANDALNNL